MIPFLQPLVLPKWNTRGIWILRPLMRSAAGTRGPGQVRALSRTPVVQWRAEHPVVRVSWPRVAPPKRQCVECGVSFEAALTHEPRCSLARVRARRYSARLRHRRDDRLVQLSPELARSSRERRAACVWRGGGRCAGIRDSCRGAARTGIPRAAWWSRLHIITGTLRTYIAVGAIGPKSVSVIRRA
jgi:hypothetical protein